MQIKNKTFLVTGGASGLGLATARMLVENGACALLADLDAEAGKAAQKSLGNRARFVQTNVTDEAAVQNAIDIALETWDNLHGAVNCAGIGQAQRVLGKNGVQPLANFSKVIQVNLIGTFNVFRLAANAMQHNPPEADESGERGVLISTASVAAFDGQIGQAAYSASKGGIVAMTLPLARELARFGIRVTCIAPGIFETPLMDNLPEAAKASLVEQALFPARLGHPAEFAALVRHVLENQMLNGEVIRLDGGMRMGAK